MDGGGDDEVAIGLYWNLPAMLVHCERSNLAGGHQGCGMLHHAVSNRFQGSEARSKALEWRAGAGGVALAESGGPCKGSACQVLTRG